jgi:thiopurine S-methyltransferase
MDHKFWRDKWIANQIGFHEDLFHPLLCDHWATLEIDSVAPVFVPLCGKSKDMVWLRERGHEVIGVELSEVAAEAFFGENDMPAVRDELGPFSRYRGGGYTLLCGDVFDLTAELLGPFAAIYDRAALIALPPDTRRAYARHLQSLCAPRTLVLLITLSYPPEELSPPPFIVPSGEVDHLYASWCEITLLATGETTVKGVPGSQTAFRLAVR